MRTMYESQQDLDNEARVKPILENYFDVKLEKCPIKYQVDYYAFRDGKFVGPVEYKKRSHKYGKYETVVLSYDKGAVLKLICNETLNLDKFLLVFEFTDGIYVCSSFSGWEVGFGGRTTNTRDAGDIEPIWHIPKNLFKKI